MTTELNNRSFLLLTVQKFREGEVSFIKLPGYRKIMQKYYVRQSFAFADVKAKTNDKHTISKPKKM